MRVDLPRPDVVDRRHDARELVGGEELGLDGNEHVVGRGEADQATLFVALAMPGDGPLLVEAPGVHEAIDALAYGEAPLLVLALDRLGAAHLLRLAAAGLDAFDFGLPAHGGSGAVASGVAYRVHVGPGR